MPNHTDLPYDEPFALLAFRAREAGALDGLQAEFESLRNAFKNMAVAMLPKIDRDGERLSVEIDMNTLRDLFAAEVSSDLAPLGLAEARAQQYLQGCVDMAEDIDGVEAVYAILPPVLSGTYCKLGEPA